jgi:hypothetical protein
MVRSVHSQFSEWTRPIMGSAFAQPGDRQAAAYISAMSNIRSSSNRFTASPELRERPEHRRRYSRAGTADGVRPGFVQHQQGVARMALLRDELGAVRAALRVLRVSDFVDEDRAGDLLGIIRDRHATEETLVAAVRELIELAPRLAE